MTNKQMNFQEYSITKPSAEWFESSCNIWADHYNFLLGLSFNSESENVWFQDQLNANKLYDV
jgi:hypothetical protein